MKKRTYYSDEECAMIVGGYRLTDGYQQDYAAKMGISQNTLSYLAQRARTNNLRAQFPEHFGSTTVEKEVLVHVADPVLKAENEALKAVNIRLANQLERAKRRLGKAVSLLLDDELKGE